MSAGGTAVPSAWSAVTSQAGWTVRRLQRGRHQWVAVLFALGPIAFTVIVVQHGRAVRWDMIFPPLLLLVRIVAPLISAALIADEFEERTFTYLWSRPLPRWSVLIGKLIGTVPVSVALLCIVTIICYQLGVRVAAPEAPWPALALPRALGAVSLAALSLALVAGGIAVLVPRHGLGVAYAYVLVLDTSLGAMPFSIQRLSISFHADVLGGLQPPGEAATASASAAWLAGIGLFWLVLALWRLARSEFAVGDR
jgi:hypothetical protein